MLQTRDISPSFVETIETEYVVLRHGRRLAYARFGRPGGIPVYYFHGCPGSRLEALAAAEAARAAGYELFAFERPGCGASTFVPDYRLLDWPADIAAAAERLGHARFGVIGFSGGGAYVAACAFALPDRLRFAYDLAGWAPVGSADVLQRDLAPLDRFFLKRASSLGFVFRPLFALVGVAARRLGDRAFAHLVRSSMSADDKQLLRDNPDVAHLFRITVGESFAQGARGPAADALRLYGDWRFQLQAIDFPLQIWHGTDDRFAAFSLAAYKHQAIKRSTLRAFDGFGHLRLATAYAQLFADIAARE